MTARPEANGMNERDPRVDPGPGDVLQLGAVRVRVAPCEVPGLVFYELKGKPCQIDMLGWIDWCAAMNATVVRKGEECS